MSAEAPEEDLLAAEFVLGVLGAPERAQARERSARDPAFAADVARWEQRLAPWLGAVAPAEAPAHLWTQIQRRLGWLPARTRTRLWRSLPLWRSAAALALIAAIALYATRQPPVAREDQSLTKPVTLLTQGDGRPAWLASVDRARGTVFMVPVPHAADAAGRVPELWIIEAGRAPRSLGAVSVERAHTVAVPADLRAALAAPGSVLAITLEPARGLPHAAPSGPVIAQGAVRS